MLIEIITKSESKYLCDDMGFVITFDPKVEDAFADGHFADQIKSDLVEVGNRAVFVGKDRSTVTTSQVESINCIFDDGIESAKSIHRGGVDGDFYFTPTWVNDLTEDIELPEVDPKRKPYDVMAIIPAPVDSYLMREGECNEIKALGLRDNNSPIPVTCLTCEICEQTVPLNKAVVGGRVNADSRHGYRLQHETCGWTNYMIKKGA